MPLRPPKISSMQSCLPASVTTPATLALMTQVGPPDCAWRGRYSFTLSVRPTVRKPAGLGNCE